MSAAEGSNADDEHDPEGATIGFERAQIAALLDAAQSRLSEIHAAELRLASEEYGVCERCGRPIEPARLEARPTAVTCIDCAQG